MIYKIIKCGHIIKLYEYEKLPKPSKEKRGGRKKEDAEIDETRSEEYRKTSNNRRRNRIIDLIVSNFEERKDHFLTLTFKKDIRDITVANKELDKFFKKLARRNKDFKAVAVIEFQDKNRNGVVHYHMVTNTPKIEWKSHNPLNYENCGCTIFYKDNKRMVKSCKEVHEKEREIASIWGNGHVDIKDIHHVDNIGAYLTSYMAKDLDDKRLQGRKAYFQRGKLIKPQEIKNPSLAWLETLEGCTPTFTSSYESDYHGKISFKEYNPKRWA